MNRENINVKIEMSYSKFVVQSQKCMNNLANLIGSVIKLENTKLYTLGDAGRW